jgi:hypothetical protein
MAGSVPACGEGTVMSDFMVVIYGYVVM